MRILIVDPELADSGPSGSAMLELAECLASRGHELHVLYQENGAVHERWAGAATGLQPVPALHVDRSAPVSSGRGLAEAVTAATRVQPDIVVLTDSSTASFGVAVAAVRRVPVVCRLAEPLVNKVGPASALRRVTLFATTSQWLADHAAAAGLDPTALQVVPDGVDTKRFRPEPVDRVVMTRAAFGVGADEHIVVHHGTASDYPFVKAAMDALGPTAGRLLPPGDDILARLQIADVAVASLRPEPSGRRALEALACGVPVIVATPGGPAEALAGPFDQFIMPAGNVDALGALLGHLRHWRARLPELAGAARAHVVRRHTVDHAAAALETAFERAVLERNRPSSTPLGRFRRRLA